MGMIAESAGGFCCAGRDGKIYFKIIGEDEAEMPLKLFKTYKFGEEYKISRVAYEDGTRSFKYGDETRNTLWINQDNIFIVDDEQVSNIYNKLKNLTINSFEGTSIINPAWDMGDKIIIDGKPIIYQGQMKLNGRFIADIKSKISIKQQQETTVKKESQTAINRKVQSLIDQVNGTITQVVEETEENASRLSKHEQRIDSITDTVSDVETKLENDYYTKTETNSQIKQTSDSITSSVNKKISTAKQEAIDSANNATDNKLDNYSTTVEMNSAITQKANSITSEVNNKISTAKDEVLEEANSKIEQTAESINSEVRKKVGNDEIISKINQSAEKVQINAEKISLKRKRNRFDRR